MTRVERRVSLCWAILARRRLTPGASCSGGVAMRSKGPSRGLIDGGNTCRWRCLFRGTSLAFSEH